MKNEKVVETVYDKKEGVYKERKSTLTSKLKEALIWLLAKLKLAKDASIRFLSEHKAQIIAFFTMAAEMLFFAFELYKLVPKNSNRGDRTYRDPRTGIEWRLRRPLKTKERVELERRRQNGELVGEILQDMGVLAK